MGMIKWNEIYVVSRRADDVATKSTQASIPANGTRQPQKIEKQGR